MTLERLLRLLPEVKRLGLEKHGPGEFGGGGWTVRVYIVRKSSFLIIY